MEIFDYNQVSAVRSVPVVEDWRSLSQADFLERADCPMIFQSLGADIEAKKRWDRRFLGQFSEEMVQVKSTFALPTTTTRGLGITWASPVTPRYRRGR